MSKLSRENTALKMKGAGDGIKTLIPKSTERIPVPSSRKFTATTVRDESVQLKLKQVLDDIQQKQGKLKKSKSIAEITPTKSNRRKPKRPAVGGTSMVLHATPRPPVDDVERTPSGRVERERRLEVLVYHRMLLCVWRRSKARLAMVSESLRRRQDQICNLEKQVDCLKDLTQSECHKRGEATGNCQRMESILQTIRTENSSLIGEKVSLQNELNNLRSKLENSNIDLENLKNEIDTKNVYVKRLESDILRERQIIENLKKENEYLSAKVKARDVEIKAHEEIADRLSRTLGDVEKHLRESEAEKRARISDLQKLSERYQSKVKKFECVQQELSRASRVHQEMRGNVDDLKEKLAKLGGELETVSEENERLRKEMCVKRGWWKNARDFMAVSWAILQNAAYIMLPAL
ncbi:fibrinogen- and Ig-binding protein-like isoform X2 [Tenebrio molitor]|uniref:fibrinogen- and Ig-binding protein-like isoform X2 n=1 Tax=Tenebrio molitor TaxID=7067 RepID=UPI0036247E1C